MHRLLFLVGLSISASACNETNALLERHVDRLVSRFDAGECHDAHPERFGRLPDEEGEGAINAFFISEVCAESIRAGLAEGDFEQVDPSTYSLTLPSGSRETVWIGPDVMTNELKVEWRVFD